MYIFNILFSCFYLSLFTPSWIVSSSARSFASLTQRLARNLKSRVFWSSLGLSLNPSKRSSRHRPKKWAHNFLLLLVGYCYCFSKCDWITRTLQHSAFIIRSVRLADLDLEYVANSLKCAYGIVNWQGVLALRQHSLQAIKGFAWLHIVALQSCFVHVSEYCQFSQAEEQLIWTHLRFICSGVLWQK